jgi:hypothetical protein
MILGLWLIVSPFVLDVTGGGRWNSILVGVVVAVAVYTLPVREPVA